MVTYHFGPGTLPLRWIFIFPCLLHLCSSAAIIPPFRSCLNGMTTPGYTIPRGDIILTLGSPLEIYCTLNLSDPLSEGYTSDDIRFERGAESIDQKYVTVINETTARLYMENLPITEQVRFHYCYVVKRPDADVASLASAPLLPEPTRRIVCANYVEIGVKPQNVSDFDCVSRNWERLNCTWKEPNNGILSVYTLYYSIPATSGRGPRKWYRCPQRERNTCEWSLQTSPPYIRDVEFVDFRIEAGNKLGNLTQIFKFDHYARVIPGRARELAFLGTTARSIYIEWNIGIFNNFKTGLDYRVSYAWYLADDWNDEQGRFNSRDAVDSRAPCRNLTGEPCWKVLHYGEKDVDAFDTIRGVNVTDLKYPNIAYDFRVEMKSSIAADHMWSEPASLFARTDPCAPYYSPETDSGAFRTYNENSDRRREVLVYWKDIPPEEQNGIEFRYEISVFEDDDDDDDGVVVSPPIEINLTNNSFAKFANLSLGKSYRFVIKSVNYFGSAPFSTQLRLPKKEDMLPELVSLNKVSFGDGVYELSWLPMPSTVAGAGAGADRIANFTIFWCQSNREYPSPCSGPLNWTHSAADTLRRNFTLDPNFAYQFAVSVNSRNSTSGMNWATCTTFRNLLQKMKNIRVSGVGSNYIDLVWKLECSERAADIKGYNITYCPAEGINGEKCLQPEANFLVNGDTKTNHARIAGLRPFTRYKISASVFTDKLSGPPSDSLCNRTLEAAPDMADVRVRVLDITNSSAVVKWNQPTTLNGVLNRYEIWYNNTKKIAHDTAIILTDLTSYDSYEIRILACTISCSQTNSTSFQTSIGAPAQVAKVWIENAAADSTRKKLKWLPPDIPAGPNPKYDVVVVVVQIDRNSTTTKFETNETETAVKISCELEPSHSAYTFFVRAKNIDSNSTYFGPWSAAYSVDCINPANTTTTRKITIGSSFVVIILLVMVFLSEKGIRKWKAMKDVRVVLPVIFDAEHKGEVEPTECEDDDKSWKEDNEGDRLNKDEDLDQSSVDGVNLKLNFEKREQIRISRMECSTS